MFESLVVNITGAVSHQTLKGREYLVAPATGMMETVLTGSGGPIFYPKEEIKNVTPVWNHKRIVITHPKKDGNFISAADPVIMETQDVGFVLNSQFEESTTKFKFDMWMDKAHLYDLAPTVYSSILANQKVEISTGVIVDKEDKIGEHNGITYNAVARNLRPDHLAILPDEKGAFSIEMGGGILANSAHFTPEDLTVITLNAMSQEQKDALPKGEFGDPARRILPIMKQSDIDAAQHMIGKLQNGQDVKKNIIKIAQAKGLKIPAAWHPGTDASAINPQDTELTPPNASTLFAGNRSFSDAQRKKLAESGAAMHDGSFPIVNTADLKNAIQAYGRASDKAAAKKHIIKRAKALGKTSLLPADWNVTTNAKKKASDSGEMSYGTIRSALYSALSDKFTVPGSPSSSWYGYIQDIYQTFFVYSVGDDLYKLGYTTANGSVTLDTGNPVEVMQVTEYRTIDDGDFVGNFQDSLSFLENVMTKVEIVNGLITNSKGKWAEADRTFLMTKDETWLNTEAKPVETPAAVTTTPAVTTNSATTTATVVPAVVAPAKAQTEQEYIASAPPGIRALLTNALSVVAQQKTQAIATIIANKQNMFTEAFLTEKDLPELQALAALAAPPVVNNGFAPQPDPRFMTNFVGNAGNAPQLTDMDTEVLRPKGMQFQTQTAGK